MELDPPYTRLDYTLPWPARHGAGEWLELEGQPSKIGRPTEGFEGDVDGPSKNNREIDYGGCSHCHHRWYPRLVRHDWRPSGGSLFPPGQDRAGGRTFRSPFYDADVRARLRAPAVRGGCAFDLPDDVRGALQLPASLRRRADVVRPGCHLHDGDHPWTDVSLPWQGSSLGIDGQRRSKLQRGGRRRTGLDVATAWRYSGEPVGEPYVSFGCRESE